MTTSMRPDLREPVLLVVGLALLLCCGVAAVGAVFIRQPRQEPVVAARVAIELYLGRLMTSDYHRAYGELCTELRSRLARDDFVAQLAGRPPVRSYRIDSAAEVDPTAVQTSVTVTDVVNQARKEDYRVVPNIGAWRVCTAPSAG